MIQVRLQHFLHPASSARTIIKKLASPEEAFRAKHARGAPVELREWAAVYPDNFFTSLEYLELDPEFVRLSQSLHVANYVGVTVREMWNIYNWVRRTRSVPGDAAEVGVYKGASAKIICEVKGERRLHLFDTFKGLPDTDSTIDTFKKGDMAGNSLEQVRAYLSEYPKLEFYEGIFPDSARQLAETPVRFSFVHLDVDIYSATFACLSFFYPRMPRGAALLSHDYRSFNCRGVKKAFDQFFADKPEPIIELWDTQALIIKQ
jgi:hypothetical protein